MARSRRSRDWDARSGAGGAGQEAEQRERVVGREEAGERQELRLQETAGCGGGAAAPGSRERARRARSAEKVASVWEKFRYLAYT